MFFICNFFVHLCFKGLEKGILLSFPWMFLFALPILHFGIWLDVEGVAFAQAFLEACLALTQVYRLQKNIRLSVATLCLVVLTLLSLFTLPFHILADLSWFGHPEGCVGVWTVMTYAILLFVMDQQEKDFQKTLTLNMAYVTGFLILLTLIHPRFLGNSGSSFVIYHFTTYMMWPGIACLLLVDQVEEKPFRYTLMGLGALALMLSLAKTAWIALMVAVLILGMTRILKAQKLPKLSLMILPIICFIFIYFMESSGIETLSSRAHSLRIVMADFFENPWSIFTGIGFGQMSDSIIRQTLVIGQRVFHGGVYQPTWEGIGRYDSSSLNQYVDMLMGCGVLGMLAFFGFHLSPLYKRVLTPLRFMAIFLLMACSSTWFMMISTYPILIMALGMSSHAVQMSLRSWMKFLSQIVFLCLSVALFWTSVTYLKTGVFYSRDLTSLPLLLMPAHPPLTPENIKAHKGPGAVHLAFWTRNYYKKGHHALDDVLLPVLHDVYRDGNKISLTMGESLKDAILHFKDNGMLKEFLKTYAKVYPNRPDLFG